MNWCVWVDRVVLWYGQCDAGQSNGIPVLYCAVRKAARITARITVKTKFVRRPRLVIAAYVDFSEAACVDS